jgi:hypothetical protein
MINKIKKALIDTTDLLREQATNIGEGAREKSFQLIEDWLQVFPKLEIAGLKINSFALSAAISPALEVELESTHEKFSNERLEELMKQHKNNPALFSVFQTIRTTYSLHRKTYANLDDPLIVKIKIKLSPEIKVYIGKPIIE